MRIGRRGFIKSLAAASVVLAALPRPGEAMVEGISEEVHEGGDARDGSQTLHARMRYASYTLDGKVYRIPYYEL